MSTVLWKYFVIKDLQIFHADTWVSAEYLFTLINNIQIRENC